ncbi:MAG: superoxide dismutase family protein [Ruminiclostridium sp.]|nr:superoxide dismutase family protein [Ruminiclostridium sp.]
MKNCTDLSSVLNGNPDAQAVIHGSNNYPNISGTVRFYQLCNGVIVSAEITGLPTECQSCKQPIFAFHIHNGTECCGNMTDPFAKADGHYNPNNCMHPYHAGDMPPLFGARGKAMLVFLTDRFDLSEILGKAVIIHGSPDDFTTQPSGNAGEKIACGIVKSVCR